jgi:hypothetical protein
MSVLSLSFLTPIFFLIFCLQEPLGAGFEPTNLGLQVHCSKAMVPLVAPANKIEQTP